MHASDDGNGPRSNSEAAKIERLQRLVIALQRKNTEQVAGLKTALRLMMILMRDYVATDEYIIVSQQDMEAIASNWELDLQDMLVDDEAPHIAVALKRRQPKPKGKIEVVDAVGTPHADAIKRPALPN